MYILNDQDIEFVVNDYLKEYTEDVRQKVSEIIKQNREQFSQYGQGRLLQRKISNEVKPDFDFDVLSQKLFCKKEENELKSAGLLFYQWSYGSKLCKNSHSQMNNKIFKIDEDDYYYVKKPGKLLVRRERPPSMPKGSLYNANKFCNCIMLAYEPSLYDLSVVDKEPEPKLKTTSIKIQSPQPQIPNILAADEVKTNNTQKAIIICFILFVLIAIIVGFIL